MFQPILGQKIHHDKLLNALYVDEDRGRQCLGNMMDHSNHSKPGESEMSEQFSGTRELLKEFYAPYNERLFATFGVDFDWL